MAESKRTEFSAEGVTVNLPQQSKRARVTKLPLGSLADMRPVPGGFQPGRLVINFGIVDEDDPDVFLTEFDPPFELRVRYTQGDLNRAQKAGRELELGFWDGQRWVRFTREKHQFELQPDSGGGVGVVSISRWGDPPIAWGP